MGVGVVGGGVRECSPDIKQTSAAFSLYRQNMVPLKSFSHTTEDNR